MLSVSDVECEKKMSRNLAEAVCSLPSLCKFWLVEVSLDAEFYATFKRLASKSKVTELFVLI